MLGSIGIIIVVAYAVGIFALAQRVSQARGDGAGR